MVQWFYQGQGHLQFLHNFFWFTWYLDNWRLMDQQLLPYKFYGSRIRNLLFPFLPFVSRWLVKPTFQWLKLKCLSRQLSVMLIVEASFHTLVAIEPLKYAGQWPVCSSCWNHILCTLCFDWVSDSFIHFSLIYCWVIKNGVNSSQLAKLKK